jgi:hypothetical protein
MAIYLQCGDASSLMPSYKIDFPIPPNVTPEEIILDYSN